MNYDQLTRSQAPLGVCSLLSKVYTQWLLYAVKGDEIYDLRLLALWRKKSGLLGYALWDIFWQRWISVYQIFSFQFGAFIVPHPSAWFFEFWNHTNGKLRDSGVLTIVDGFFRFST